VDDQAAGDFLVLVDHRVELAGAQPHAGPVLSVASDRLVTWQVPYALNVTQSPWHQTPGNRSK
jgi:hypothetical protein